MEGYPNFNAYNGDAIHDMYVDSDYEINTSKHPEVFDEADFDDFIDNRNDIL